MRKLISYVAVFVFLTSVATAQDYTFKVLVNKGSNKIQRAGGGSPEALKTGSKLFENDQVIASQGAYIGLMHKSGKTTEIKDQGTKKVSDIAKTINVAGTSMASRYARFVSNKMNAEENTSYRSRLNATGAVSRAVGESEIQLLLPQRVELLNDQAIISWVPKEGSTNEGGFIVKVENIFDEEIVAYTTNETSYPLDFSEEVFANNPGGRNYFVTIVSADDESIVSQKSGVIMNDVNNEIVESHNSLKDEVSDDTPLNKLIYASFYEENGLFLDAVTKYEEIIKMAPEVEEFKAMYKEFKVASGLEKEETE